MRLTTYRWFVRFLLGACGRTVETS